MLTEAEKLREKAQRARSLARSILDPAAEDRLLMLADELEERAELVFSNPPETATNEPAPAGPGMAYHEKG